MDDILNGLNERQKEAVLTTEGYVRVIAGAGTGKTRALTHRYAYLVNELGISASNILCITFTNKAANEMRRRIKQMLGSEFDTSFVATLHAFCTRVLREDISKLFYPGNFIVLDLIDQKKILEEVYDELGVKMDTASFKFIIDKIKYYKNLLTYVEYLTDPSYDFKALEPKSREEEIIIRYIEKQKKYFGLDFFDLINFTIHLFNNYPGVEEKWQERMHYVMVDEFQDITNKEFKFIRRLTELNKNWFVVGDPDQNIYEWRGSRMKVLLDFDKKMEPCKTIIMNENYRSTPQILNAANTLIEKNEERIEKELITHTIDGENVIYLHAKNDKDEIKFICERIREHVENGGRYRDIAVLYRSNFVSRFIEQGFMNHNVPYMVYGGVGFYERAEVKDVLSYLRLISSGDDLSFLRVINVPRRKMGKMKVNFLRGAAAGENITLYEALVKNIDNEIFRGTKAKRFVESIEKLKAQINDISVSELLQRLLIEVDYELYIRESGDIERLDNITELIRSIVTMETEYGELLTLPVFLQNITLYKDSDEENSNDTVKIMTAHTSKGLEFDMVFIAGLTEGIFPSARALEERKKDALEEERRLAFVSMTRARKKLYISESEGFGIKGYSKVPSRFIFDIDSRYLDIIGVVPEDILNEYKIQVKVFNKELSEVYKVGDQLLHKVFGEGIVESVDEKTRTYYIRFMHAIKPISFNYNGISHLYK